MIELIGFFFIVILGTISHFLYEWSGHKKIFALFCAVNESTWEHIKLAIGPTFLWMLIEVPFLYNNPNFLFAKCVSILFMILFIPAFFYLYRSIFKKDILFLDIIEFFIAIGLGQFISYKILNLPSTCMITSYISLIILIIIFVIYLYFTFNAPKQFLFIDPLTDKTGLDAHKAYDKIKNNKK